MLATLSSGLRRQGLPCFRNLPYTYMVLLLVQLLRQDFALNCYGWTLLLSNLIRRNFGHRTGHSTKSPNP